MTHIYMWRRLRWTLTLTVVKDSSGSARSCTDMLSLPHEQNFLYWLIKIIGFDTVSFREKSVVKRLDWHTDGVN